MNQITFLALGREGKSANPCPTPPRAHETSLRRFTPASCFRLPPVLVMISRVLSDAANKIRDYLSDPANRDVYIGATRSEIEALVAEMDRVRKKLETPPP